MPFINCCQCSQIVTFFIIFRVNFAFDPEFSSVGQGLSCSKHSQVVHELMDITGTWKSISSDCLKKLTTPAKRFTTRWPSLPDLIGHTRRVSAPVMFPLPNDSKLYKCEVL